MARTGTTNSKDARTNVPGSSSLPSSAVPPSKASSTGTSDIGPTPVVRPDGNTGANSVDTSSQRLPAKTKTPVGTGPRSKLDIMKARQAGAGAGVGKKDLRAVSNNERKPQVTSITKTPTDTPKPVSDALKPSIASSDDANANTNGDGTTGTTQTVGSGQSGNSTMTMPEKTDTVMATTQGNTEPDTVTKQETKEETSPNQPQSEQRGGQRRGGRGFGVKNLAAMRAQSTSEKDLDVDANETAPMDGGDSGDSKQPNVGTASTDTSSPAVSSVAAGIVQQGKEPNQFPTTDRTNTEKALTATHQKLKDNGGKPLGLLRRKQDGALNDSGVGGNVPSAAMESQDKEGIAKNISTVSDQRLPAGSGVNTSVKATDNPSGSKVDSKHGRNTQVGDQSNTITNATEGNGVSNDTGGKTGGGSETNMSSVISNGTATVQQPVPPVGKDKGNN